jgi:hypothetical protein
MDLGAGAVCTVGNRLATARGHGIHGMKPWVARYPDSTRHTARELQTLGTSQFASLRADPDGMARAIESGVGFQRDRRLDQLAARKLASCAACKEIDVDGLSYQEHTCGIRPLRAPHGAMDALSGGKS